MTCQTEMAIPNSTTGNSPACNRNTICPYSYYCLQFYLLFPIVKLGQSLGLPSILSYLLALALPPKILEFLVKNLAKHNLVTLVPHHPKPNHSHSSDTTLGVVMHSAVLGVALSVGLSFIDGQLQQHFVPLGFYLILLSSFHMSEYFVTSLTNPSTLRNSSFLTYPSLAYVLAISASFVEYLLEVYYFNHFKKFNMISMIGLIMALLGETIRKMAMFTAGQNFSHLISSTKKPHHKLVTHGIYALFRHPSYAGWFYWAIGTQILLLNPICTILFALISYNFFKDRIIYEEETLIEFFNDEYRRYREKVGLWMPIRLGDSL